METKNRAKKRGNIGLAFIRWTQTQLQNERQCGSFGTNSYVHICSVASTNIYILKFNIELQIILTVAIQTRPFIASFVFFLSLSLNTVYNTMMSGGFGKSERAAISGETKALTVST